MPLCVIIFIFRFGGWRHSELRLVSNKWKAPLAHLLQEAHLLPDLAHPLKEAHLLLHLAHLLLQKIHPLPHLA